VNRLIAVVLAVSPIVGCSPGSGVLTVEDPWMRPTPPGIDEAALYLAVINDSDSDDRLLSAESSGCMVVTPHLTEIDDGVSRMTESGGDELDMAPGDRLVMEPNALHLMCLGLVSPLVVGEQLPVTLRFAQAGEVSVDVIVEQR
jgi:copper(I)-binding protein